MQSPKLPRETATAVAAGIAGTAGCVGAVSVSRRRRLIARRSTRGRAEREEDKEVMQPIIKQHARQLMAQGGKVSGLCCPFCQGGTRHEKSFTLGRSGQWILYRCWRANKCGHSGGFNINEFIDGARDEAKADKGERAPEPEPLPELDIDACLERLESGKYECHAVSTGWPNVDKLYRAIPGEVTIVVGAPGSGKSEWLLSLTMNLAEQQGWRFLHCALEAETRSLTLTLLEKRLRRQKKDFSCPASEKTHQYMLDKAYQFLDNHYAIFGAGNPNVTVEKILATMKEEAQSDRGIHGVIIDPYNYLARDAADAKALETAYVSKLMGQLKSVAAELNVAVWIVVPPVKQSTWLDERPSINDAMGSANWYNKCDTGIALHRPRDEEGGLTNLLEVHVEKTRNRELNVGMATLEYAAKTCSYIPHSEEETGREKVVVAGRRSQRPRAHSPSKEPVAAR